jgi:hypothetical protein
MKLSDKIIEYLKETHGAVEVTSPSRKYRKFTTNKSTYWVGRNGALRAGDTVSDSVRLTEFLKDK